MSRSGILAASIALVAVLWIGSGFIVPSQKQDDGSSAITQSEDKKAPRVQVVVAEMIEVPNKITLTGRTDASRAVQIKSEIEGVVNKIHVTKGQKIAVDGKLLDLDVRDRAARLREARELVEQRRIEYNAAKNLAKKGFNSTVRVAQTQAELEKAKAQLSEAEINLDNVDIKAPYDGVVNDQFVELGDFVRVGDPLFSLIDLDPIEVSGFVSEREITRISLGMPAKLEFLDGRKREGQVTFLASAADPDTRTFRIEVAFENADHVIQSGLTTKVIINAGTMHAVKISPSILSLNDAGVIGVKIVDRDAMVKFTPVQIIEDTPDYTLVQGIENGQNIITVGQDFVVPGQKVEAVAQSIL